MKTSDKLKEAFEHFRPHITGHNTAMNLFFEAVQEVEQMENKPKGSLDNILEEQSRWLMTKTSLEVEKIVDLEIHLKETFSNECECKHKSRSYGAFFECTNPNCRKLHRQ